MEHEGVRLRGGQPMTIPPYDADKVYPNGRRCIWLKTELDTGVEVRGGAHIQGTCKLLSGPVYDLSCKGCSRYEGW